MFRHKTKGMKVEVGEPRKLADEIGELISLFYRCPVRTYRELGLSDDAKFPTNYPELFRLYLELRVRAHPHAAPSS